MSIQGTVADGFAPVAEHLSATLADGSDFGASLCVIRDGKTVVDIWGGRAAEERAWQSDTLANLWSLSKTVATVVALRLVDTGKLDLDAPIADHWPEFGAAGKESITLRHILSHTSGVPGWQEKVELVDLYDVPAAAAKLAAQEPWWEPGQGSGYATIAFGHLVDEIVRRVDGRSIAQILTADLTGPHGIDLFLGTPTAVQSRVAPMVPPPPTGFDYSALDPDSVFVKTMINPYLPVQVTSTPQWLAAELAGVNIQGNARSIAQLNQVFSHGGMLGDTQVLSPTTVQQVYEPQSSGPDRVLAMPITFGLGLGLSHPDSPGWLPDGTVSWWAGYGGSIVVNDAQRKVTMAYVPNRMTPELVGPQRTADHVRTVWECLS